MDEEVLKGLVKKGIVEVFTIDGMTYYRLTEKGIHYGALIEEEKKHN